MTDYDITVDPGVIWDDLRQWNTENYENKFEIEHVENKHILMKLSGDADSSDIVVKVKFF